MPVEAGRPPQPNFLNSNCQHVQEDLQYTTEDIKHVEEWVKRMFSSSTLTILLYKIN